ncbi:hypothetical protein TNCV_1659571 [Trichonephila clavipes]|nr:hypothetical protein TNCV_1659571 [Trichonephila clavipes]
MDRWRHDCGARSVRIISRPGSRQCPEGRFDLSTFRFERYAHEAKVRQPSRSKRSSSRDVGTKSSYRYHTATLSNHLGLMSHVLEKFVQQNVEQKMD